MTDAPPESAGQTTARGLQRLLAEGTLVEQSIRIGLLAILIYWSFLLLRPFLGLIVWAVILAVTAYPVFRWLSERLGGRDRLCAVLIALLGMTVIIGPVALLADSLSGTISSLYQRFQSDQPFMPAAPAALQNLPLVGGWAAEAWTALATNFEGVAAKHSDKIASAAQFLLARATGFGIDLLIFLAAIVFACYLLVAGPGMLQGARRVLERAVPGQGAVYLELIGRTVRNVAVGVIGVALFQSVLGGLVMLLFGVPGAGVLALIALGLGIVQVGVGAIFTPVAIVGLVTMDPWQSVPMAVLLIGLTVIDNYLRPVVMGRGLDTPALLVFFGLIGGVTLHGFIGVFIGPVILTVGYRLAKRWTTEPA